MTERRGGTENIPGSERTRRIISEGAEKWLHVQIPVLDNGFVTLVDYHGSDEMIENAARVSYGEGTRSVSSRNTLLRYLKRHDHTSPFEMAGITVHAKMPILVARQWVRHRTASLNEYSARYSVVPDEYYVPDPEQISVQSTNNKQGRGESVNEEYANQVLELWRNVSQDSYEAYQYLLNDDGDGNPIDPDRPSLAREISRGLLPVNFYTQWYWSMDLHNLFHFLRLRMDEHAQWEIRQYADAIYDIVTDAFPLSWKAFKDYELDATKITGPEKEVLTNLLTESGVSFTPEQIMQIALNSGMKNKREREEFLEKADSLGIVSKDKNNG